MKHNVPSLRRAVRAAATCEISWIDTEGKVGATALTPLSNGDRLTVAFTFGQADQARAIARAETVTVTVTDRRSGSSQWTPLIIRGNVSLRIDLEGETFTDTLLPEELVKYPPSRVLADSIILRREYWWYLPRFLLDITPISVERFHERSATQPLLFTGDGEAHLLEVNPFESDVSTENPPIPESAAPGPAALFAHDFSVPDMEQWTEWIANGRVDDKRFQFESEQGALELPAPRGMFARVRHQSQLEKSCRKALAAAGQKLWIFGSRFLWCLKVKQT